MSDVDREIEDIQREIERTRRERRARASYLLPLCMLFVTSITSSVLRPLYSDVGGPEYTAACGAGLALVVIIASCGIPAAGVVVDRWRARRARRAAARSLPKMRARYR